MEHFSVKKIAMLHSNMELNYIICDGFDSDWLFQHTDMKY